MTADPLRSLIRLRRLACEGAVRELAAALDTATRAEAEMAELRHRIAEEELAASRAEADDLAVEAFGRWFRRAKAELQSAERHRDRAEAETARARAGLIAARAALEAAEAELARRRAEQQFAAGRAEQIGLDEIAQRRGSPQ